MADELDDITHQLNDLKKLFTDVKKATDTNEAQLENLNKQLNQIRTKVSSIEKEIDTKKEEVEEGEKILVYQKSLLNERARSYYKNIANSSYSLLNLLAGESLSTSLKNFTYQKSLVDEDRRAILRVVMYIKDLEEKKASLESEQKKLATLKVDIDKQSEFLKGEVASARQYQGELQQKIATLTAKQQQLLGQRLASLNIPRSAGTSAKGCSDDRDINPGFSPRLAFFTYGAPHRNGLNQYGAKGRADAGQSYNDMLNAYYSDFQLSDFDPNTPIIINGTNEYGQTFNNETMNLEDYIKHLYEMPSGWPIEALKAQAIAARTYALRIMKVHGSIQPNQGHQVVKKEINAQSWVSAVDQTRGKVMLRGGEPFLSEYASTHGGYVRNLGRFDGSGGNPGSFADLNGRAYDKASPWFYCDWGARSAYNNTAWLKTTEVADMVNVVRLAKADSSAGDHLYQTDKGHPYGGEVWNEERVKQELRSKGITPFNSVSDVSVSADFNGGSTSSVNFSGDAGSVSFSGSEFKDWFNLRAPANLQIVGPLYNVEKR